MWTSLSAGIAAVLASVPGVEGHTGVPAGVPQSAVEYVVDDSYSDQGVPGAYGYFTAVERSVGFFINGEDTPIDAHVNEPVLNGDRVLLGPEAFAAIGLADGSAIRLGNSAELLFSVVGEAGSGTAGVSVLDLVRGDLQLVAAVPAGTTGPVRSGVSGHVTSAPTVLTANAEIVAGPGAVIVVTTDGRRSTGITAREGTAQVITVAGATEVRAGAQVLVEGQRGNEQLVLAAAPALTGLEVWADAAFNVAQYPRTQEPTHLDQTVAVQARGMRGHGDWIATNSGQAWRPYVAADWAPYRTGRWRYTSTGWFWVSYEPWGWAPYRYGYWDLDPFYGWVWYPGTRFRGAHVVWYWGPDYVGWAPLGYYRRHFSLTFGYGLGWGVYGWAGGSLNGWGCWTFVDSRRLGHRNQHQHSLGGGRLARDRQAIRRGLLLTDAREMTPDRWRDPRTAINRTARLASREGRALVDVTGFVSRNRTLDDAVVQAVSATADGQGSGRSARPRSVAVSAPESSGTRDASTGLRERPTTQITGTSRSPSRPAKPRVQATFPDRTPRPTVRTSVPDRTTRPASVARPRAPTTGSSRLPSRTSRPQIQTPPSRTSRPMATRPVPARTPRPAARPTTPTRTPRPAARPTAPTRTPRPAARPTTPTRTPRPAAKPTAPTRTPRPAARPTAPTRTPRPAAKPTAPTRTPRPAAKPTTPTRTRPPAARPPTLPDAGADVERVAKVVRRD